MDNYAPATVIPCTSSCPRCEGMFLATHMVRRGAAELGRYCLQHATEEADRINANRKRRQ